MKLYELAHGSRFVLDGVKYVLETIDGMYSRCFDQSGNLYHIGASTEVEPL